MAEAALKLSPPHPSGVFSHYTACGPGVTGTAGCKPVGEQAIGIRATVLGFQEHKQVRFPKDKRRKIRTNTVCVANSFWLSVCPMVYDGTVSPSLN